MKMRSRLTLALAAGMALALPVSAGVLVNDTWLDGTRTDPAAPVYSEMGVDSDSDGNLESAWFKGGGGTLDPVGPGGPLRGALGASGSSSWTTYFTDEANPVTLGAIGDNLKVTWKFKLSGLGTGNTSQNFRVAVVNSPAAARLSTEDAPASATYTGYGLFANMGPTLGNSNPFRLVERTNPTSSTALLSASGEWTGLSTTGAANGNPGYANDVEYTFEMSLTRGAGDSMDINLSIAGGNLNGTGLAQVIFNDVTPNGGSFSFDTFSVRPSDAATTASTFDTTLFRVVYTPIPEPATIGLAIGAAGLLLRRRRD